MQCNYNHFVKRSCGRKFPKSSNIDDSIELAKHCLKRVLIFELQKRAMVKTCSIVLPVFGYVYNKSATVYETSLVIKHHLTMSSRKDKAVYPKDGKRHF